MNPKVSVVIPTYNRAEKVRKGVESVLAQSFTDLEVIVVDDGSSDDTGQSLKYEFGDRIRYYFQPNQGVSTARNKGIEEARGEWIAFLDSDDLWEKEKLEAQLKALEQVGSGVRCVLYRRPILQSRRDAHHVPAGRRELPARRRDGSEHRCT
jgi:glycosyltransferase involved in cell wall biosynthesis